MLAQHLAERLVQEVGRGMMGASRGAVRVIHLKGDFLTDLEQALVEHTLMQ